MYKHVLLKETGTDRILIMESSGTIQERKVKNYLKAGRRESEAQMNKPIYTMTDAELQAENDRLRRENDRLCKALADMAEENAELRAKYDGLVAGVKALKNKIREEEKRHAGGRKSGGAGAGKL